jgi:hypothetical protein
MSAAFVLLVIANISVFALAVPVSLISTVFAGLVTFSPTPILLLRPSIENKVSEFAYTSNVCATFLPSK